MYRGFDNEQGCEVAWNSISLKYLTMKDRMQITDEVKLNRKLNHPNIVHFIYAWTNTAKEELVIITEIVTGGNLKQYLKRIKSPRLRVIKIWCKQILQGLHYLHSQTPYPIIHRDIKSANIFVMNNTGDIKIGDFGLSTLMQGKMQTSVLGTPEYMAPEVYKGNYDTKIDIYSFGMVIIEICTGKSPYYECTSQAAIYKKVISGESPGSLKKINNQEVQEFIIKCLRPSNERPSAEELLNDKFLVINEEDDLIHHPLDFASSPRSGKSSVSNSLSSIDISLIINNNGQHEQITFPFNLEKDTPEKVAEEMIKELQLGKEYLVLVAKEIENKLPMPVPPLEYADLSSVKKQKKMKTKQEEKEEKNEKLEGKIRKKKSIKVIRSEPDLQRLDGVFESLKKGTENKPKIVKIQKALCMKLGKSLRVDGVFGIDTEILVKIYQEQMGMKPDGVVNFEIWDHLINR